MAEPGVRIALLARAGKARDQLHRALSEAGADIVAEGDPGELDPAQVTALAPTIVLVSLEPAIEASLDRFGALLSAPATEVMYDDAEVTAALDGWDLNRWARHLVGKLLGGAGLPPVPEGAVAWDSAELTQAGAPPTPAELMDHARLEDYTVDSIDLADSVPASPSLAGAGASADDGFALDLDFNDFSAVDLGSESGGPGVATQDAGIDLDFEEIELVEPGSFSRFAAAEDNTIGDLDADVAALAAQLESFEQNDKRIDAVAAPGFENAILAERIEMIEPARESAAPAVVAAAVPARAAPTFDFSNLALAPMDGVEPPPVAAPAFVPMPDIELASESIKAAADAGVVLILAGLGGPDAVRQLLSSLPEKLDVPVLLYQHLEVGKHERLVDQLAKISRLPVVLASDGKTPEPGKVSLLPAGMTASAEAGGLRFTGGGLSTLIAALPAARSVVVVLSGAEVQLVPSIIAVGQAGGLVLAQDPEVCFDAAAAEAMQSQGAAVYPALGLARQIAGRWP